MKGVIIIVFNYSKLKGRIIEIFGTQKAFAEAIGKSEASVSLVLSGKCYLDQKTIVTWADALEIGAMEIGAYFFAF